MYESKNLSGPKVYVLQPWIASLLLNYEKRDAGGDLLAGQVLRVCAEGKAACPGGLDWSWRSPSAPRCWLGWVLPPCMCSLTEAAASPSPSLLLLCFAGGARAAGLEPPTLPGVRKSQFSSDRIFLFIHDCKGGCPDNWERIIANRS